MPDVPATKLQIDAPAKINLYLHVTGRRASGYHTLESLVGFSDIADRIEILPASDFTFQITGPYESAFTAREKDQSPNSSNLVVRAVWALAQALKKEPRVKVILTKNLPLAAGIGGGSADAAAVISGLLQWWDMRQGWDVPQAQQAPWMKDLLLSLGADVPACMARAPVQMSGIGDVVQPAPLFKGGAVWPALPLLLVNPGKSCPTASVFGSFGEPFSDPVALPAAWDGLDHFYSFLAAQRNDLSRAAIDTVPVIGDVLALLAQQEGCILSRMSGSGATCFALFPDALAALDAAEQILLARPDWWVRTGSLMSG